MGKIFAILSKLDSVIQRIDAIEERLQQPDIQITRSERSQAAVNIRGPVD
jgi:hypothetical protein